MDVCAVEVLDDVLVFLDRLRDLAILKGDDIVRSNIHASPIRGSALAWYSTELTDFERSSLRYMPLEEGWFKMLRQRFKMRPSMALAKLTEATYTPADSIFRYALAADITSVFNQITQAWSKLSPQLRRDVPEPTPPKEAIWKDIAQVQPPRRYTRTYPVNPNYQNTPNFFQRNDFHPIQFQTYPTPSPAQPAGNSSDSRQKQINYSGQPKLLADKPAYSPAENKYVRPVEHSEDDEPPSEELSNKDDHYMMDYQAYAQMINAPEEAVSYLQCHNDFPSNNILHAHLRKCDDAPATAFQVATRIESCSPGLPRRITVPIPVKGIAAAFESMECVTFDVFFPGTNPRKIEKPHMTAKIRIEAKLLTRKVATASCCDLESEPNISLEL
ncbi:hypothetical protein V8E54_008887 [Elaphomyces granulatus]